MKISNKLMSIPLVLVLLVVVLAGCTQQNTVTPPPTSGTDGTPSMDNTDAYATELAGGTGNSSNDITVNDMDQMESDVDDLDATTSSMSESNI